MQHQAALAYQTIAKKTVNPRDHEANLLSRSAANLQLVRDAWEIDSSGLEEALEFNQKIWSVFISSVTGDQNPLPDAVKQNIANLGIFIMGQIYEIKAEPAPHKLDSLININRQLAAGLRNQP